MLFADQEKELAEFDYHLRKNQVDEELELVMSSLKNTMPEGVWLEEIMVQDICFESIFLSETGVAVFCRHECELTDPLLWKKLKKAYNVFTSCVKGVEEGNLAFYALLNSPITQKAYYGLFNPVVEFLTPVENLEETFLRNVNQNQMVYTEEELVNYISCFEKALDGESLNEDIRVDETGEYVRIRNNRWKPRSSVNAERYFWITLFGGFFGIHKFYAKCYVNFFIYLLTFGFCGIGWVFDLMEICLGIAKDGRKAYIGPFENKAQKIVISFMVMAAYAAVVFFLLKMI